MKAYLNLTKKVLNEGQWVYNNRTKKKCLTLLNQTLTYDVGNKEFPLLTTRKMGKIWKTAIAEMLCYIRGYTDLRQFHSLDVHTWDENVKAWNSPNKKNEFDTGIIYGASAEQVGMSYKQVLERIRNSPDDRGIIWNFWNPEYFDKGCLRPCMYSHQFNVINGTLYLTSIQRSCDLMLGGAFNMLQCYFLLALTAHLTGLKAGTVTHHLVNIHIYEDQYELAKLQVEREPFEPVKLEGIEYFNESNTFLSNDIIDLLSIEGYKYHPPIKYPFSA